MTLFVTLTSRYIFGDPGRLRPRRRVLHGAGLRAVAALPLQVQDQPGEERAAGEDEGDQGKRDTWGMGIKDRPNVKFMSHKEKTTLH